MDKYKITFNFDIDDLIVSDDEYTVDVLEVDDSNFIELFKVKFLQYFIPLNEVGSELISINLLILGQFSILIVAKSTGALLPSSPYGKIMSVNKGWLTKLIDWIVEG